MTETIGASRRSVLQKILGIGAGMAMPGQLAAQQPGTVRPPHRRFIEPVAAPQETSVAGAFRPARVSGIHDVRAFGAKGDGKTLDTPAINKAIEAAASEGGGTVRLAAGTYLCYSIHLKSNIVLYLERGATILAAESPAGGGQGYDSPEPGPEPQYQDYGHSHWHNALIWGVGLENVSILGPGMIWGKGLQRSVGRNPHPEGLGDKAISLKNCHNVTLRDFSILEGGHFGILATGVDNFTIDNLIIDTNRDGMDIDCCRNVRVSNTTVNSPWDDGICLKSSYALGYARSTEDLTLTNCMVTGSYELGTVINGTFKRWPPNSHHPHTGRIKCGTESNGGFKNITISNCVFDNCQGFALETVDGALLEDISITNITMRDIVNLPIFLRLGARMRGPAGAPVGKLRRVNISNIVVDRTASRYASILTGIPGHEIEDVRLSEIYVLHEGGGTRSDASIVVPEKAKGYPEPTMFGTMPAYGFYIRHVKGFEMSHIELKYLKEDQRPPFVLDQVEAADFVRIKAQHERGIPMFALSAVKDFNVYLTRSLPDTHLENVVHKNL